MGMKLAAAAGEPAAAPQGSAPMVDLASVLLGCTWLRAGGWVFSSLGFMHSHAWGTAAPPACIVLDNGDELAWSSTQPVGSIVVAAAKLDGDAAFAADAFAGRREGPASEPPLHTTPGMDVQCWSVGAGSRQHCCKVHRQLVGPPRGLQPKGLPDKPCQPACESRSQECALCCS